MNDHCLNKIEYLNKPMQQKRTYKT